MYTFAIIVCSMMVGFGGLAFIGDKVIGYWMEKKGVCLDDEYEK